MLLAALKFFGVLSIYRTLKAPAVRSRRARVQAAYDIKDPSAGPRSRSQVKGIKAELSLALLVACAALLERLTDVTLAWLPLYNQAKLILWIWLLVSRNLVAPSFLVFFHRCVRPYEPFIDTTLHVLDDAFLMVSSVLAWLFRPFARAWSWIKPVFVSKPPPTPVPKERRKMRYSMRADFPGALPKTPGPPHLSGSQNGLATPSSVGKQDLMAAFEARHSGTPAGSLAAKAQALADAQLRADAAAIKTTTTKGSSRQPIKQKKKDANAGPAAPSARVLGKRKGPTAVTTTSIKSVASELSENAGEDDVDVDVEEKNKDAEEYGDKKPRLSGTHGIPDAERRPAIVGSFDMDDISLPKPRRSPPRRGSATAEARRVVSAGPLPKPSRQRTSAPAASQATSTTATATAPASRVPVTKRKASDTALVRERDRLHARSGGNGKKVSALDEDGSRANGAEEEAAAAERPAASNVTMKRPRHRVASK